MREYLTWLYARDAIEICVTTSFPIYGALSDPVIVPRHYVMLRRTVHE